MKNRKTSDGILVPCPFCGCEELELCRTNENACWVRCHGCGGESQTHKTRKGALKNWNRRFDSTVIDARIVEDDDADFWTRRPKGARP